MKYTYAIFVLFLFFCSACSNDPMDSLQEGIEKQNIEQIKSSLSDIYDINTSFKDGMQPLQKAIVKDNIHIVQLLLDKGAEVNPKNKTAPFLSATSSDMIDFLIRNGADVDASDSAGNTLLHSSKAAEITTILLQQKAKINQQNKQGETPLMKAAQTGNVDVFMHLLQNGADTTITDQRGKTAIEQIAPNSDVAVYWQKEKERQVREAEKKRQKEEEKRRKLALQNVFPAKGKTGYICNYGTACQVLIKDVAGGKVKVEILEKCWPRSMNTMNISKALDAGNVQWFNKSRIYKQKKKCS